MNNIERKKRVNVVVKSERVFFKLYLNDILHIVFRLKEFVGFQSWIEFNETHVIEIYLKDKQTILCEYTSRELWVDILKELDQFNF